MIDYLHDFRQDIITQHGGNWDGNNILYKTLVYELSAFKDVERYKYVKNQVFNYFDKSHNYINGKVTLDIMNGWWFCFKTIFELDASRKNAEPYLKCLNEQIKDCDESTLPTFIEQKYGIAGTYTKSLLAFLHVIYTIGNITPINSNRHADCFDSWEYKLFEANWVKYEGSDYMNYFLFNDYREIKWWEKIKGTSNPKEVVLEYMDSRVLLITTRGRKIQDRENNGAKEENCCPY